MELRYRFSTNDGIACSCLSSSTWLVRRRTSSRKATGFETINENAKIKMEIARKTTSAACTSLGHALQTGSSSGIAWSRFISIVSYQPSAFRKTTSADSGDKSRLIGLWSRRWVTKGHGTEGL